AVAGGLRRREGGVGLLGPRGAAGGGYEHRDDHQRFTEVHVRFLLWTLRLGNDGGADAVLGQRRLDAVRVGEAVVRAQADVTELAFFGGRNGAHRGLQTR